MPSSRETVVNRALGGDELKKIILADMERLVANEGLLSHHIAFGRVSYKIRLELIVDNPSLPNQVSHTESRPAGDAEFQANPSVAVIDTPAAVLANRTSSIEAGALELTRNIDSPNAERLRESMPVPVLVKGQDGTTQQEMISYPKDSFPELGPGDMKIADVTAGMRAELGLPEPKDDDDDAFTESEATEEEEAELLRKLYPSK